MKTDLTILTTFHNFDQNWWFWRESTILTRSKRLCWVRRVRHFCAPPSCFARPHRHCGEVGNIVNIQSPFLLSNTNIQYIGFSQKRDFQNAAVFFWDTLYKNIKDVLIKILTICKCRLPRWILNFNLSKPSKLILAKLSRQVKLN